MFEFYGTSRFEVIARLGDGAAGVVYEAHDRERDTRVALKQLRLPDADALLRFKNEFRSLQELSHPNLVLPGELIEDGGAWFFTMELVVGVDFLRYVRPGDCEPSDEVAPTLVDRDAPGASPDATRPATEPPDAPARVPAGPGFDEARLRAALAQLARGVSALHAAGKVHCDIKPANIVITSAGRLALLDLGLVADLHRDTLSSSSIAGTAHYMAPEQAASGSVGPEADWYAVGVLLYQSLTGRLPFHGSSFEVMTTKQTELPPAPSAQVSAVPADLDTLCMELLRTRAEDRPSSAEILTQLAGTAPAHATGPSHDSAVFVGRERELDALHAHFAETGAGRPCTVLLVGESGVGKTALVRRFVEELGVGRRCAGAEPPLVLLGRCYPSESVPYRAIDGVIDAIARHLSRLPPAEVTPLLPHHAFLLAQVFPVLRRVEAFATARRPSIEPVEERERRMRVFEAVREQLARIGARWPTVVVIDDIQWADADSAALLREVLREPDAPQVMLLGTARSDELAAGGARPELPGRVVEMPLGGLGREQARELARRQAQRLDDAGAARGIEPGAVAAETRGHPLFITELVRYAGANPGKPLDEIRLEQALYARIRTLDARVRRLLELCAVAGAPIALESAARAAEAADMGELSKWVVALRAGHLVRTSGARPLDLVETYHDRVRAAVLQHLSSEERAQCHRRIAVALEGAPSADPEALSIHWRGAGDLERAGEHALTAAEQAAGAFAFDRAARLLREVVELRNASGAERVELLVKLGEALSNAGRGLDAAETYLDAASDAPSTLALELRRLAAEELLRSGHLESGMKVLVEVLSAIDMHLPATPFAALVSLLETRLRVRLRGLRFRERLAADVPREALTRVDTCWAASTGLAMVDNIRGADFQARYLLLALRAGEPLRVARALAMEAMFLAVPGGKSRKRADANIARAEAVAHRTDDAGGLAYVELARTIVPYLRGEWLESRAAAERTERLIRDECAGMAWELFTSRFYRVLTFMWTGHFGDAAKLAPALRAHADEHGNRFGGSLLRNGLVAALPVIAGRPEVTRAEVGEVMGRMRREGHLHHDYWEALALANAALYEGDVDAPIGLVRERWRRWKRSMFLRVQYLRIEALWLRGRAAVAAAAADPGRRRALLTEASRAARRIDRERMPWGRPMAAAVRAAVAHQRGNDDVARDRLALSARSFRQAGMEGYAQCAEHGLGQLLGGDEGRAICERAAAFLAAEGAAEPARVVDMWLPGLGAVAH